jgi:hypothetical protein
MHFCQQVTTVVEFANTLARVHYALCERSSRVGSIYILLLFFRQITRYLFLHLNLERLIQLGFYINSKYSNGKLFEIKS